MPKMLSSECQSHSIQIEDFKNNPINPFNPFSTKGELKMSNILLDISENMPKILGFKFRSHSIKIKNNPIHFLALLAPRGE